MQTSARGFPVDPLAQERGVRVCLANRGRAS
jgi:hypothetical protein